MPLSFFKLFYLNIWKIETLSYDHKIIKKLFEDERKPELKNLPKYYTFY